MLGALEFHIINANIFSWVESMRMCSNECFTLSLEDNRKIDGQKENKAVLIQVTVATSYYPQSSSPAQHRAADTLQPLMWQLLQEGRKRSASLGAG